MTAGRPLASLAKGRGAGRPPGRLEHGRRFGGYFADAQLVDLLPPHLQEFLDVRPELGPVGLEVAGPRLAGRKLADQVLDLAETDLLFLLHLKSLLNLPGFFFQL